MAVRGRAGDLDGRRSLPGRELLPAAAVRDAHLLPRAGLRGRWHEDQTFAAVGQCAASGPSDAGDPWHPEPQRGAWRCDSAGPGGVGPVVLLLLTVETFARRQQSAGRA